MIRVKLWHFGTLTDITQRKEYEDELKASEERFRLLAEYSSDMITLHDMEGNTFTHLLPAKKFSNMTRQN